MNEIVINKDEFFEFNWDDQFGFFYGEDGFPVENDDELFPDNVEELYSRFDHILVTMDDDIYGIKGDKKELIMQSAYEAFYIACEVKDTVGEF